MIDNRSTTIKREDIKDLPVNELFKGLPKQLKDPKMYKKVEKVVLNIMFSDHKHVKIKAFMNCKRCKIKVGKRKAYLSSVGFADYPQYLTWKKVMQIIHDEILK